MQQPLIRVDTIGREGHPVVVIDHFSPHPDRLLTEATAATFTVMGPYYPGVRAPVSPTYFEGLAGVLNPVLRDVFGARGRVRFDRALYSLATTAPSDLSLAQRIPHIDGVEDSTVAIIHYLAPHDASGTAFYRQRSTGFEAISADRHGRYLDALRADVERHGEPAPGYIDGDTPLFERIAAYGAAFNRALIYRGNLLHCARLTARSSMEASVTNGRLTVASFLTIS